MAVELGYPIYFVSIALMKSNSAFSKLRVSEWNPSISEWNTYIDPTDCCRLLHSWYKTSHTGDVSTTATLKAMENPVKQETQCRLPPITGQNALVTDSLEEFGVVCLLAGLSLW